MNAEHSTRDAGMQDRPSVSLLVPVYNREDLLGPCLDSALAQTMPDLEVVVVDGASTDGTWAVCLRYAAADPRVRIFRDATNTGPVRGWWRCVTEARGRFATFLWSDDLIGPRFLEKTLPSLANAEVGFVFAAAEIGSAPGTGTVCYSQPSRVLMSGEFIEGSLGGAAKYPVSPACGLFRIEDIRESFRAELPTDPATDLTTTGAGTDVLLFLLTALRYPRVACLAEPLAFFRAHPGSITVDGRAGEVELSYARTKNWFASTYGYGHLTRPALAKQWFRDMRAKRRWIRPAAMAARYRHPVSAGELLKAAAAAAWAKVARAASARIRGTTRTVPRIGPT